MARTLSNFGGLSDPALLVKGGHIHMSMTGNTDFPTPTPALTVLQQAIDDFEAEVQKGEGGTYDAALKNQKRDELIAVLQKLGRYVDFTADGDRVIILSSGFEATKQPTPRPPVVAASNLKVVDGASAGEVALSFDGDENAVSFIYQHTPDPLSADSVWVNQVGTTRKTVISNLQSGKAYWFRVITVGRKGQQAVSEPVRRVVQ